MYQNCNPIVGDWYQSLTDNSYFEVVAIDANDGSTEIQFIDGEVSEIEHDLWVCSDASPAAAPEDWAAAYDVDNDQIVPGPSNATPHYFFDPTVLDQIDSGDLDTDSEI